MQKNQQKYLIFLNDPTNMVLPQVTFQIIISQGYVVDPAFAVRDPNAFDGGAIVVYLLGWVIYSRRN